MVVLVMVLVLKRDSAATSDYLKIDQPVLLLYFVVHVDVVPDIVN